MSDSADATSASDTDAALIDDPRLAFRWESYQAKDRQVVHLQRILMFHANQLTTDPRDASVLACAWERLENRLNRMRMKPEPKPVDVSQDDKRGRAHTLALASDEADPSPVILPKVG
jgi:hypothetical protein